MSDKQSIQQLKNAIKSIERGGQLIKLEYQTVMGSGIVITTKRTRKKQQPQKGGEGE